MTLWLKIQEKDWWLKFHEFCHPDGVSYDNFEIEYLKPDHLAPAVYEFLKKIEKIFPVETVLTGTPASRFAVANTAIHPESVRVKGAESVVSALTCIRMKPVDISGISKSLRQSVALDLPDGIKPAKPEQFIVEVTVKEKIVVKRIDNVVIQGYGRSKPFQISPATIEVAVKGPARVIGNLTTDPDFDVYVDLEGLDTGVYVRRAVIMLPLNTTLVKATPEIFTVHIGSPNENGG